MRFSTALPIFFINIKYYFLKALGLDNKIIPYKILVELTNHCNSKCNHCDIWKIPRAETTSITANQLENVLKSLNKNILWIALSGGEISLYQEIDKLLELIQKYCTQIKIITFTTNGLNPERVLKICNLIKVKLNAELFVTISLDGDESTHDHIRGVKGNYKKAHKCHQILSEAGYNTHFGLTVTPDNEFFIQNGYESEKNKIKAITFQHTEGIFLTSSSHINRQSDTSILSSLQTIYKKYDIRSFDEILMKIYIKIGIRFIKEKRKKNIIPCDVGFSSLHLDSNGNVKPCMYLPPFNKDGTAFKIEDLYSEHALNIKSNIKKGNCPNCWMNCYAPHNMMQSPISSIIQTLKS